VVVGRVRPVQTNRQTNKQTRRVFRAAASSRSVGQIELAAVCNQIKTCSQYLLAQRHMLTHKRGRAVPEWSITFDDVSSLRSVAEAAAAVMQKVIFKVSKVGAHYFLMVDGADPGVTCFVSARLQLYKVAFYADDHAQEFTFCVECGELLTSIDIPSCTHASLIMEGHDQSTSIHLRILDPELRSCEDSSELNTYVDGDERRIISPLTYNLILEIDLVKLRELIKKARKARAELLRICISTRSTGSKERSVVLFSVKGAALHKQLFSHETSRDEDGSLVVRAAPDGADTLFEPQTADTVFDGMFPISKIDAFVKTIGTRMLTAKLQQGIPLMLTHRLGGAEDETSHIHFLVAPVNDVE